MRPCRGSRDSPFLLQMHPSLSFSLYLHCDLEEGWVTRRSSPTIAIAMQQCESMHLEQETEGLRFVRSLVLYLALLEGEALPLPPLE